jgi:hypothetical protein
MLIHHCGRGHGIGARIACPSHGTSSGGIGNSTFKEGGFKTGIREQHDGTSERGRRTCRYLNAHANETPTRRPSAWESE